MGGEFRSDPKYLIKFAEEVLFDDNEYEIKILLRYVESALGLHGQVESGLECVKEILVKKSYLLCGKK